MHAYGETQYLTKRKLRSPTSHITYNIPLGMNTILFEKYSQNS